MKPIAPFSVTAALLASTASAQVPVVVADIPITHSFVSMVMGELGTPQVLLEQGADPHDFQLRPSQARALAQAGLVVWMGEGMTPWLESALGAQPVLDLSSVAGVETRPFADWPLLAEANHGEHEDHVSEESHDEHGHDEHGHDEHGHDEHADHDHGSFDPHLWLDPANASAIVTGLATALAEIDPTNAATYRANAVAAQASFAALDARITQQLTPSQGAGLVVFHDAYGYFAAHYGLNMLGSIAEGDAADPGAQRLATIRENLSHLGATCLFPEAGYSDRYLAVVAEGTDLRVGAPLDPEGRALEPGAALYGQLMSGLADAITDCASGT